MGSISIVSGGSTTYTGYNGGSCSYTNTAKSLDVTSYSVNFTWVLNHTWSTSISGTCDYQVYADGGCIYSSSFSFTRDSKLNPVNVSCSISTNNKPNTISIHFGKVGWTSNVTVSNISITANYTEHSTSIALTSPSDEAELSYGSDKKLAWTLSTDDTYVSQTLYYKKSTASTWNSINIPQDTLSEGKYSYTFAAKYLSVGTWLWYVKAVCTYSSKQSVTRSFDVGMYAPSVTDLSPDETTVERGKKVKFSWSVTSKVDVTSQTLYWKLSTATSYNAVTVSKDVRAYTFNANTFPIGTIQWYLKIVNTDATVTSSVAAFTSGYPITVKLSSPANNATLTRSIVNTFKWSVSCSITVSSVKLYWKKTTSSSWNTITLPTDDDEYDIAANTFPLGTIRWYIKASNTDGISNASASRTFTCGQPISVSLTSPIGTTIPKSLANTFEWAITTDLNVTSTKLYWKMSGAGSYNAITLSAGATSYTFAANRFSVGTVYWYVQATNADGVSATSAVSSAYCGSTPTCEVTYPREVNIRNDVLQIFTFAYEDALSVPQTAFELGYKAEDETSYTTVVVSDSRTYYEFAASTFDTGNYTVRVRVTNSDGLTSAYNYADFVVVGQSEDPEITDITNSSIPTITWTSTDQDTFEIEIFYNDERIYESGVQIGQNVTSFTPNIMLEDDSYSVRIRTMNIYGYFSNWIAQSFVLSTEKPAVYTCYAYANSKYGIDIRRSLELDDADAQDSSDDGLSSEGSEPTKAYVVRSEYGADNWQILGQLDVDDEMVIYHDYTPISGVKYEYAIRSYLSGGGYADSNSVTIMVEHKGLVVYDFDDETYVNLFLSEDQQLEISQSASKEYNYSHMIGREWPVRESSDWKNHSLTISCYVTIEQYEILLAMMMSEHSCWCKRADFSYACAVDSLPISRTYLNKGYTIELTLSQVDAEEVDLLE